ncbi:MAG: hypothetical protein FJW88_06810 [Actinobacteria bacterium]|nr:hypothetical protein [Actinomycetota bacterium]
MRRFIAIGLVGMASIGLVACSSDDVKDKLKDAAKDQGVDIDTDNGKVTIEGKDGEGSVSFGKGSELPDGFPEDDVPLPDGGKIVAAFSSEDGGRETYSVTYQIDASDAKSAMNDYKSTLEDAGFTVENSMSFGGDEGSFSGFSAQSSDWDVAVSTVGGSDKDEAVLSIAVSTHEG